MDVKTIPISFEFFPPNTDEGLKKLAKTCDQFKVFNPEYFSVTFGAGGSHQDKTFRAVNLLLDKKMEVAPHLSCIGLSKACIREMVKAYVERGVTRIVAIRGDLPEDFDVNTGDFQHSDGLVRFLRNETGNHFYISVAAYPEFHPQSNDIFVGIKNFQRKINAGANDAITQYFFNSDAYFYFLESCQKIGINVPIVPGIMPIYSCEKLLRFSSLCGAEIPAWLLKRLEAYRHDTLSFRAFGIEVVTKLCETLIRGGAPGLHFYTLNQSEPTRTILENLSLKAPDHHADRLDFRNIVQ